MDETQYPEGFRKLLEEFAVRVGAPALPCSEEGVCTFRVAEQFLLNLIVNPNDGQLILWFLLGELPLADNAANLANLLRANLFWQQTQGATISMLPDEDVVVLVRQHPVESLDAEKLEQIIDSMTEVVFDLSPLFGNYGNMPDSSVPETDVSESLLEDAIRV